MDTQTDHYEFINSQTGNILAHVSVPRTTTREDVTKLLNQKCAELATAHGMFVGLIFWQKQQESNQ